jgi:hypothetical protein
MDQSYTPFLVAVRIARLRDVCGFVLQVGRVRAPIGGEFHTYLLSDAEYDLVYYRKDIAPASPLSLNIVLIMK